MANDLNQCNFIGRLGKDVETRYTQSGDTIASFSLAVGSQWKDKNTGDKQESTEWVNVLVFGALAGICETYLAKGSQVYISGRMKTDKYTDKQGVEKYSTKIIAERMQMLGGKSETREAKQEAPKPKRDAGDFTNFESDIPF